MTRIFLLVLMFLTSIASPAQTDSETKEIKKVMETFFDALHNGDSTLMATTLRKDIKIQTTRNNQEGERLLFTETREQLLTNISKKKASDKYEEKLLSYDIKVDGNLASVWTPYEFYFNDSFSHCGANSFQLFHNGKKWEIIYLVDMRRRGNCKALKDKK